MKSSNGFYSLYLFVLLIFVGLGIGGYFYSSSKYQNDRITSHISSQMLLYENAIKEIIRVCFEKYDFIHCQKLDFNLGDGFWGRAVMDKRGTLIVVDLSIEYQNPLTSLIERTSKREIWKIK